MSLVEAVSCKQEGIGLGKKQGPIVRGHWGLESSMSQRLPNLNVCGSRRLLESKRFKEGVKFQG